MDLARNHPNTGEKAVALVEGGPNKGMLYFRTMPFLTAKIMINDLAFDSTMSFVMKHPKDPVSSTCSRNQVLSQKRQIQDHEGLTRLDNSHAVEFHRYLESSAQFRSRAESIILWADNDNYIADRFDDVLEGALHYSNQVADTLRNLWKPKCSMMGITYDNP